MSDISVSNLKSEQSTKILKIYDNEDFNLNDDLNNGQIYLIRNTVNGKCYIGQANCFTGTNNNRWGTLGRWKSHVREAIKPHKDHCTLLNNAIRKYGETSFEISTLLKCKIDDMNDFEVNFIKEYNSLSPNGYNLKEGGYKSKNTPEIIQKMKDAHTGTNHSEETKESISKGQMGNRRASYNRKYEEDKNLPKYIRTLRDTKENIVSYLVGDIPIGIDTPKYSSRVSFSISKYGTKENALEKAIEYLNNFLMENKIVEETIIQIKKEKNEEHQMKKKEESVSEKLPEFIYPIIKENKISGYYVKGMFDFNGNPYEKKEFYSKTNRWNLNDAKKYVEQLKYYTENKIDVTNFDEIDVSSKNNKNLHSKFYLPKYVNIYNCKGEMKGFMINGYPHSEYVGGKYKKQFSDKKLTLEQNYKNCIDHLELLKITNPIEN